MQLCNFYHPNLRGGSLGAKKWTFPPSPVGTAHGAASHRGGWAGLAHTLLTPCHSRLAWFTATDQKQCQGLRCTTAKLTPISFLCFVPDKLWLEETTPETKHKALPGATLSTPLCIMPMALQGIQQFHSIGQNQATWHQDSIWISRWACSGDLWVSCSRSRAWGQILQLLFDSSENWAPSFCWQRQIQAPDEGSCCCPTAHCSAQKWGRFGDNQVPSGSIPSKMRCSQKQSFGGEVQEKGSHIKDKSLPGLEEESRLPQFLLKSCLAGEIGAWMEGYSHT